MSEQWMVKERTGVEITESQRVTIVEDNGQVVLIAASGPSASKVFMGIEDARHLATCLRRAANRVEFRGMVI